MKSVVVVSSLALLTLAVPAFAGPDPAEIAGPRPNELVPLGEGPLKISPQPYAGAKKYTCALTQGKVTWSSGEQPYPICAVPEAEQKKFKPGDATITVRVFFRKWLPAATETIQLTGSEEAAVDETTVDQVDPANVVPLTGGGKTFTIHRGKDIVKFTIAVGADKWKVLRPEDVGEDHIMFHRGNDERATAEIFTDRCDADNQAECPLYEIATTLKCGDTPDRKVAVISPTRTASSCVWTKEMGNKRAHSKELVHWEAGGYSELDPASRIVVSCGLSASSPSHFAEVMRLCATMKLVK